MSLLHEELVIEWLNRKGYFTIHDIRIGNNEIDVLAIKPTGSGCERRHIEVSVSANPIAYLTIRNAKTRNDLELRQAVDQWIDKKFGGPAMELKQSLCRGDWTKEVVLGKIKHEDEIQILEEKKVITHRLEKLLPEMAQQDRCLQSAGGRDLYELMMLVKRAAS